MRKNKPSPRSVLTASVFILILGGFFLLNRVVAPPEVSQSERRPLEKMPEFTASSVSTAAFMGGFEGFAADSFVFRDGLRTLRALVVFDVFFQTDKGGLYRGDAGAGKIERVNEVSVRQTAAKITQLAQGLEGLNLYYSFVPDKSIYAGKKLPGFDAGTVKRILAAGVSGAAFIDLAGVLAAEDYYRGDLHWDQARLSGVLDALGDAMDFADRMDADFDANSIGVFEGVYAGQLALPLAPDKMTYLTNPVLENAVVRYLNPRGAVLEEGLMYDLAAFSGRDPYDLFLGGAQPLVVIDNPAAATERRLYIFRDSFSSSLAPLLVPAYAQVTLIDLRYMDSRALPRFVDFAPGSDVLFLYSSQIMNNASVLL